MKYYPLASLAVGLLAGVGCVSSPRMSGNAAGPGTTRNYRELYVRPEITQFFLLPQRLNGPAGRAAEVDLVVRDSAAVPLYGLLHVSLADPDGRSLSPADTVLLGVADRTLPVAVRTLFVEHRGKAPGRLTRLEAKLTPLQVTEWLRAGRLEMFVGRFGEGQLHYQPSKKAAAAWAGFTAAALPH